MKTKLVSLCVRERMRERDRVDDSSKRNKATLSWLRLVCCRHEVPVTSEPITVIHMDEDVVVVNKPASIPVSGVLPELYCQKIRITVKKKRKLFQKRETGACMYPVVLNLYIYISHQRGYF